jgi:hypothetical protein
MWKNAFWLMRNQWLTSKIGILGTMLFYAAYGAMSGFLTMEPAVMYMSDIFVILFMTSTGFVFSRAYMYNPYWANDHFTKNLAALRSLPIPVSTLSASRLLQVIIASPASTLLFLAGFYGFSSWLQGMSFGVVLGLYVCWLAYGMAGSSLLILLEWGTSGKRYLVGTGGFMLILFGMYVLYALFAKKPLLIRITDWMQQPFGWFLPAAALLFGALAVFLMNKRLQHILMHRDFT